MTTRTQPVTVKLPVADLRRIPSRNRSAFIREAVREKLAHAEKDGWKPRTELGRKLWALRQRHVDSGAPLLDAEGIAAEIRERRGGLA
jgi:hypothetical protein